MKFFLLSAFCFLLSLPAFAQPGIIPLPGTGSGNTNSPGVITSTTSPSASAVTAGKMVYVDRVIGSDVTALRGVFAKPCLTLTNAQRLATNGDTIIVRPGVYLANQLGKNGVNWRFEPGCTVSNYCNDSITNSWLPIFSDFGGATNYVVSGRPDIVQHNGTNFQNFTGTTTNNYRPLTTGSTNSSLLQLAAIATTNPASRLKFELGKMTYYSFAQGWGNVNIKNGTVYLDVDEMLTGYYGITNLYLKSNGVYSATGVGSCIHLTWYAGETFANVRHFGKTPEYAAWSIYPLDNEGIITNNLWLTSDHCEARLYTSSYGGTNAYTSGNLWRNWYDIKWLDWQGTSFGAANFYAGYNYLRAEKVSSTVADLSAAAAITSVANGYGGARDTTLWLDVDKLTANGYHVSTAGGRIYGRVAHFDDSTNNRAFTGDKSGILNEAGGLGSTNSGIIDLTGNLLTTTNGAGITHRSGITRLSGFKLSSIGGSVSPVIVSTNGLTLQNVLLVSPTNRFSIQGTNGTQTVATYATFANTITTNTTTFPTTNGFLVDPNVR